jgi:hypothetical protein
MDRCLCKRNGKRGTELQRESAPKSAWRGVGFSAALIAGFLLLQFGCLLHRHKTPAAEVPPSPIRIAMLPFNTPPENADIRWLSLAAPIMMAQAAENSPELEIIPLWQAMPAAMQVLGTSRSIGPDQAAYIAGLLTSKWAVAGEFTPAKKGVILLIDFIPSKETMIAFRYEKQTAVNSLQANFLEALTQFLRYQVAKPSAAKESATLDAGLLRELAPALDLEYGWFASSADPGKAEKVVATLAKSDGRLAQILFNANLYPAIGQPAPTEKRPGNTASPDKSPSAPDHARVSQPRPSVPRRQR